MGELIEFPLNRARRAELEFEMMIPSDVCEGIVHVFDEVPGHCKCGENEWTPDHSIEPDGIGIHAVFDPPAS